MEQLNELVELAKKATSGEWIADSGEGWDAIISQQDMVNGNFIVGEFIGPDSKANKDFVLAASPENVLAIAEAFWALEREKEAAEAKLADLANQPAIAWLNTREGDPTWPRVFVTEEKAAANREWVTLAPMVKTQPLFTRPAPAADLAELVPNAKPDLPDHYSGDIEYRGMCDGWNACRAAILRNIEEAK